MPNTTALKELGLLPADYKKPDFSLDEAESGLQDKLPENAKPPESIAEVPKQGGSMAIPTTEGLPPLKVNLPNQSEYDEVKYAADKDKGEKLKEISERKAAQAANAAEAEATAAAAGAAMAAKTGSEEIGKSVADSYRQTQHMLEISEKGMTQDLFKKGLDMMADNMGMPELKKIFEKVDTVEDLITQMEIPGGMDALSDDPSVAIKGFSNLMNKAGVQPKPEMEQAMKSAQDVMKALGPDGPPPPIADAPGVYVANKMAARMTLSMTTHGTPLMPGPGALTVLINNMPTWRGFMDVNVCPVPNPVGVPHGPGMVIPTQFQVFANFGPVACHTDMIVEAFPGNMVIPMPPCSPSKISTEQKKDEVKPPSAKFDDKDKTIQKKSNSTDPGKAYQGGNVQDDPGQPDNPPLDDPEKKLTWIEIEMVYEDGSPVAGANFLLKLADGSTTGGQLDEKGKFKREDIEPGNVEITFPDYHETEVEEK